MTLTYTINSNLPYICLFSVIILFGVLFYKIFRILSASIVYTVIAIQYKDESEKFAFENALQKYAQHSLIGECFMFLVTIVKGIFKLVITFIRVVLFVAYTLLPLMLIIVITVIINEQWNQFLLFLINVYNEDIGPILKTLIMFPLEVMDIVGSSILPILNLLIYTFVQMPIYILFESFQGIGKNHFFLSLKALGNAFPLLGLEIKKYAEMNNRNCIDIIQSTNGTSAKMTFNNNIQVCRQVYGQSSPICTILTSSEIADICFNPREREINLYENSALQSLEEASGHAIMVIGSSCRSIALIANFTLFPIIDPTFWRSVNKIANGVLSILVTTPLVSVERCKMAGGLLARPSMCTPDFGPAFDLFVEASLLLGKAITNWLDMIYILIFDSKDGEFMKSCSVKDSYTNIFENDVKIKVFGSNSTVLVRMEPGVFALTDGTSTMYVAEKGAQKISFSLYNWPISINPKYGVARTLLPSGGNTDDNGIGLFGCTCITEPNTNSGALSDSQVNIQCATSTKNGKSWIIPTKWSLAAQSQLMTCSNLRIVVQSIRYAQKRVMLNELSGNENLFCNTEECLAADLAVYVIPVCGTGDKVKSMACLPENIFTRGICFPYCMALHLRKETAKPLYIRGAQEWQEGVMIAYRDCISVTNMSTTGSSSGSNAGISTEYSDMETICNVQSEQSVQQAQNVHTKSLTANEASDFTPMCSYTTLCTTIVRNKSSIQHYQNSIFQSPKVIPFIKSGEYNGNRLVLDGQPIVVAGSVIMRKYVDEQQNEIVDFPTLIGNEFNEFTVEYHASFGLPVSKGKAPVPSKEIDFVNKEPGTIYLPQALSFVPQKIAFTPATLSTEALWYVTNPSYEWLEAMINYCSSNGTNVQMQVSALTSYSPMALWRIQYQRSSCFLRYADQKKICSPNVSKAFPIDSAKNFPSFSSEDFEKSTSLIDICLSNKEYNLWAESMEDFDEYNVVIGIRRGSMKDMGFLLSTLQASSFGDLKFSETNGKVVFYFVSKLSLKIREVEPWTLKDHLVSKGPRESPAVSLFKMSCPQLRVLPDVGKFVGHSLAAFFYLIKLPINFVMNPFIVYEILEARALKRCPENSLRHSGADDCGLAIFSLTNYFEHMYMASESFWSLLSWVLFKITGGVENELLSKEALIFSQFLQGGVVMGDATKIISLFDITKVTEALDTGAEDVIFNTGKGRRRLLGVGKSSGSKTESSGSEDSDDTESKSGEKKGSGKGILSQIAGTFKGIFSNLFSITTSSAQLVSGNVFEGANLGMLLASQDPVSSLIPVSITAPGLAWAQVTYESVLPIALDLLANAKNGLFTVKPLWVHMYNTMDLYDNIIHERHKRLCMGYRLLLGYGSAFGKAIHSVCLAAAEMPRSTWTVILTLFVDVNLYRCMCVNSAGQEFLKYSYENCEYLIASNRKGLWQSILNSNTIENVCQEFEKNIHLQLYHAFDGWTSLSYEAANAITNFLDELFVQRSHAFDCNNIESNPSAIVMTPLPVNHFHVCGKTTSCKNRCEESIMVFEAEYNLMKKSANDSLYYKKQSFNTDVESPFFNKYNNDWSNSGGGYNVLQKRNSIVRAIYTTPFENYLHSSHPCSYSCTKSTEGRCIRALVETIGLSQNDFEVIFFCMPEPGSLLATIYKTGVGSFSLEGMSTPNGKMSHVEFSIQNTSYTGKTYLISYVLIESIATELENALNKKTSILNTNEVYLWKSNDMGKGWKTKILSTQGIMAKVLTAEMQNSLYGNSFTLVDSYLSNCDILGIVELHSNYPGKFVFAFSFRVSIEAKLKAQIQQDDSSNNIETKQGRYELLGLLVHCDRDETLSLFQESSLCENSLKFYIPEKTCDDLEVQNCLTYTDLEKLMKKVDQGTMHHVEKNFYMFIPRNSLYNEQNFLSNSDPYMEYLEIDMFAPKGMPRVQVKNTYKMDQSDTVTMDLLGSFSRRNVFESNLVVNKKYRDPKFYKDKSTSKLYYYQINAFKSSTSIASEWIEQVRLSYGKKYGYQLRSYSSNNYSTQSNLIVKCSTSSCVGCTSPRLRLLCAQAQNCILAKCVGTVVQTRNVFCGIGNVFESMSKHAIITWNAMYNTIVELLLIAMKGINGEMVQVIALKFPTDEFYALLCSVKDSFANMVGLGMSIIQMLSSNLFSSSGLVQGLSISGDNEEIGVLMGEKTLKIKSIGNMFFNMLIGSTLLPTMALHKFLICTINSSLASEFNDLGSLSVSFVDVAMDKTWLECSKVGGMSSILNNIDMGTSLDNTVATFAQFSISLLSGLGQTILYALQLSFDATADFFISLVWSLQDIITTFNVRACKVPNYALRYVLWCSCQDEAYKIPDNKRDDGREEGALWCVGTLSVNLLDGTQNALIYNPYTMKVLDESMGNLVSYIYCRSTAMDSTSCDNVKRPHDIKLNVLSRQGVDPLVVWSKCKSNYLQSVWDNGAGAIFMEDSYQNNIGNQKNNPFMTFVTKDVRAEWRSWASSKSTEFLQCLQEPSRMQYDYSSCMRIYFSLTNQQTPNAYFIYDKDQSTSLNIFPPDACKVFTGIAKSANKTPVQSLFEKCVLDQEFIGIAPNNVQSTDVCELNHVIWSTKNPQKRAVASLHGTSPEWSSVSDPATKRAIQMKFWNDQKNMSVEALKRAWQVFNETFQREALEIKVALFTADGDLIHNFFDCMYMGPYTRIDIIPCDQENVLECEYYARDEYGGKSRNFTACLGNDVMHNDSRPPYTCGSRARRSLIKYFFREIYENAQLKANITKKINEKVSSIIANYTSENSLGCYSETTKNCAPENCNLKNGFSPCLNTNYDITGMEMSDFIVDTILPSLEDFYQKSLQDTKYWTLHSNKSMKTGESPYPFQWKQNIEQAKKALEMGHFTGNETIQMYSTGEVYGMPLYNASDRDRKLGSLWSLCMSLLSQPSLNHPVEEKSLNEKTSYTVPVGLWNTIINAVQSSNENLDVMETLLDMTDNSIVKTAVKNMIKESMKSHSPHFWQKNKRHGPSQSSFCKKNEKYEEVLNTLPSKIHLKNIELLYVDESSGSDKKLLIEREELEYMWHEGFLKRTIGNSHTECICSHRSQGQLGQSTKCVLQDSTCKSLLSSLSNLQLRNESTCVHLFEACENGGSKTFDFAQLNNNTLMCLQKSHALIHCPEFGLSDTWGFFPADCGTEECDIVDVWNGLGSENVEYNPLRFLMEGRGGIRISNYKHHNATYHYEMKYSNKKKPASSYAIKKCFALEDMHVSEDKESEENLLVDNVISDLFPVVQVVHESHVSASCSRYIIELARLQILDSIGSKQVDNALLQAQKWKTKCESKLRHLSICNMMGMYFEIPPPEDWSTLAKENCNIEIVLPLNNNNEIFLTPWCLTVNQSSKKVYDTHRCLKNTQDAYATETEQKSNVAMVLNLRQYALDTISPNCELLPNPLNFLQSSFYPNDNGMESEFISFSSVSTAENQKLLPEDDWLEEMHTDISLQSIYNMYTAAHLPTNDLISQIYDWWPEDILRMPAGFHVTSSIEKTEFNPVVFDSHFAYDESTQTSFYVHTAFRNKSLFHDKMGAVGICRSPNIGMPLFDPNTNLLCTRVSKFASEDIPTHPVSKPKTVGGLQDNTEWPFSQDYIDKTFHEEKCTVSSKETPWIPLEDDVLGLQLGSIPSIQYFMYINKDEKVYYDPGNNNAYPPYGLDESELLFNGIHSLNTPVIFGSGEQNWSSCDESILWKAGVHCDTKDTSKMCPDLKSVCLAINNRTTQGMCYPTIVYEKSITKKEKERRLPCFASFHCPDNQVCLADGGCFQPYLHFWNNLAIPIEHSVLSNECGFQQKEHPYEQNSRGSSPWEKVDDLLHMHGFCSHRNWWSYRQSIKNKLCPEGQFEEKNSGFMKCPNTTSWPWIKETFLGKKPAEDTKTTFSDENTLLVTPQKCDTNIFHLGNPENPRSRLKYCSGHEGHQHSQVPDSIIKYSIPTENNNNWIHFFSSENRIANFSKDDLSWWLRTYSEKTNETYIGKVGYNTFTNDFPLGFLGASATESSSLYYMTSENLNRDNFKFFKCMKRMACSLPPFTYNGIPRDRINPTFHRSTNINVSQSLVQERHLRICGSIGYIPEFFENRSELICALDLSLFPLFFNLYFYSATSSCSKLLWDENTLKVSKIKIIKETREDLIQMKGYRMNTEYLYCQSNSFQISEEVLCVYKGRESNRLSSASSSDHVQNMIKKLNSLITDSPSQIIVKLEQMTVTMLYQLVNSCIKNLDTSIRTYHKNIQVLYENSKPSGLYYALKVSTFEFPLSILQHLWYMSLLHTIDSRFNLPNFEYWLKQKDSIQLWGSKEEDICSSTDLNSRKVLLYLICHSMYPKYSEENLIYQSAIEKLKNEMIDKTKEIIGKSISKQSKKLVCYKDAKWKCDESEGNYSLRMQCLKAREFAHNTSNNDYTEDTCSNVVKDNNFAAWGIEEKYLKPCQNQDKFIFEREFELTDEYLQKMQMSGARIGDARENTEKFVGQYIMEKLNEIFEVVDYTQKLKEDVWKENNFVIVLSIKKIESILTQSQKDSLNFNFKNWFENEICESSFPFNYENVCKKQENIQDATNCLYNAYTNEEKYRYATDDENIFDTATKKSAIRIVYNVIQDEDLLDVCDFLENSLDNSEFCMVQHFGNQDDIVQIVVPSEQNKVECDIKSIHVPPGIEVQAFAFEKDFDTWTYEVNSYLTPGFKGLHRKIDITKKHCTEESPSSINGTKSCSWKRSFSTLRPDRNQWFNANDFDENGNFVEYSDVTKNKKNTPYFIDFQNMDNWWKSDPNDKSLWENEGCGKHSGVCSLNFRYENDKKFSRGFCSIENFPNCAERVSTEGNFRIRPYAVAKSSFPYKEKLYRCDQCLKKENYIGRNGAFDCHFEDRDNPGVRLDSSSFSIDQLNQKIPFLYKKDEATATFSMPNANTFFLETSDEKLKMTLQFQVNDLKIDNLQNWKDCKDKNPKIDNVEQCYSKEDFNIEQVETQDDEIWNLALDNPQKDITMVCNEQDLKPTDLKKCNSKSDQRRMELKEFAQNVYRERLGTWFLKSQKHEGVAWRSMAAKPTTKYFSLVYASSVRPEKDIQTKYILSEKPCQEGNLQDRVCVESLKNTKLPFEILNPWVGGDFNPFEGKRGLDLCLIENSNFLDYFLQQYKEEKNYLGKKSFCVCECQPENVCLGNSFQNSSEPNLREFPVSDDQCLSRMYPQIHVMSNEDLSNLCFYGKNIAPAGNKDCNHFQGIFGGTSKFPQTVSMEEFHSESGFSIGIQDMLIQSMYGNWDVLDFENIGQNLENGLWNGNTLLEEGNSRQNYAFLKMERRDLHPAHLAFSFDLSRTNNPLVVSGIRLLPYNKEETLGNAQDSEEGWLNRLKSKWLKDIQLFESVYPNSNKRGKNHWSCPYRLFSFWGNPSSDTFSPHIPNPLLSKIIFPELKGAHPLVKLKSIKSFVGVYKTTNGLCFYEKTDINHVAIGDTVHPCGLYKMIEHLVKGNYFPSKVMNHFYLRCNDIMDYPGFEASLHNGEKSNDPNYLISTNDQCGLLHRLTPFLARVVTNASFLTKSSHGLTTHSEGGDCHMGRAFKVKFDDKTKVLLGQGSCLLSQKTKSQGILHCWNKKTRTVVQLERHQPIPLSKVISKKYRSYKSEILKENYFIKYKGKTKLGETFEMAPEVSYGIPLVSSISKMLSNELKEECMNNVHGNPCSFTSKWKGGKEFLINYEFSLENLVQSTPLSSISQKSNEFVKLFLKKRGREQTNQTTTNASLTSFEKAMEKDRQLWNSSNWTWSYYTISSAPSKNNISQNTINSDCDSNEEKELVRKFVGTVNKRHWQKNRFQACNASLYKYYIQNPDIQSKCHEGSVRKFSMCEPAPTASLQKLCTELSTFKTNMQLINCVVFGSETCLYKPSMLYVPYAWSNTNGEFSSETVLDYYTDVVANKFPSISMTDICPSQSELESNSKRLRIEVKNRCPATQIDFLKETLDTIKKLGKDIIYMIYCAFMFVINLVASMFSKSSEASSSALEQGTYYMEQFFITIQKIIMPILNVIVQILFGISSAGKVFADILKTVCIIFKEIYNKVIVYLWCGFLMPLLETIIIILKGILGLFSSEIVKLLDSLWSLVSGGNSALNVNACLGRMQINIECSAPERIPNNNESLDSLAPLATPCWVDSMTKSGYSDVFSGSSEFSYLSCSLSDTCTTDPTSFEYDIFRSDKSTNLVPCASCPNNFGTDDNVKKFGCNSYLKRCTCNIPQRSISECVTNEDCSINTNNAICSLASTIDGSRNSMSSFTCVDCGRLGLMPVCVMDGVNTINGGVCACGSINQPNFLASCPDSALGQRIDILSKTGQCLISNNPDILSVQVSNLFLDFKDLSIGPCALGIQGYNNHFCVRVNLPFENGLDAGERSFVVLTNTMNMNYGGLLQGILSGTPNTQRRLLSIDPSEKKSTSLLWGAALQCTESMKRNFSSRSDIKTCIENYLNLIDLYMIENNLSRWNASHVIEYVSQNLLRENKVEFWGNFFWNITGGNPIAMFQDRHTATKIQSVLKKQQGFLFIFLEWCLDLYWSVLVNHNFVTPQNVSRTNNHHDSMHRPLSSVNWKAFESKMNSPKGECKTKTNTTTQSMSSRRKLLQQTESTAIILKPLPSTCKAIEEPITKIKNAFWITTQFYSNFQQVKIQNKSLDNEPFTLYKFYSPTNETLVSRKNGNGGEISNAVYTFASYSLSFLLTGEFKSGEEVIKSFTSNLSYEESVQGNYFTGKRFIKEFSTCNYELLTNGPSPPRKLFPWFLVILAIMILITNCFFTSGFLNWFMWIFVFPALLFWTVYSVSPICFPMIPTKLLHDIRTELELWVPGKIEVPYFLTKSACLDYEQISDPNKTIVMPITRNLAQKLSSLPEPETCFKSCKEDPFLMKTWLDPLAWWICEVNIQTCRYMGNWLKNIAFFQDFSSSVEYYSEVLEFESKNPQFTQAHRFCAFFNLHEIFIVFFFIACIVVMIPSFFEFVVEIFSSALILVFQASNAENTF
jgi:hypothetical protein